MLFQGREDTLKFLWYGMYLQIGSPFVYLRKLSNDSSHFICPSEVVCTEDLEVFWPSANVLRRLMAENLNPRRTCIKFHQKWRPMLVIGKEFAIIRVSPR